MNKEMVTTKSKTTANNKPTTVHNKLTTTNNKSTIADNITAANESMTMDSKIWRNTDDVKRDIPLTSQQVMDIEGPFSVMGNRPPPVQPTEDYDDQIEYLYGGHHNEIMSHNNSGTMEPDLAGITHMLRMVEEYNNDECFNEDDNDKQLAGDANVEVSISKLNPSAPEYKPKSMDNSRTSKSNDSELVNTMHSILNSSCKDSLSDEIVFKDNIKTCDTETCSQICLDKRLNVANLDPEEIKNMKEKLKLKIKETSNAKTHNTKRGRNVALATLMKLYTAVPNSAEDKMELIKPKYFETPPRDSIKTDDSGNGNVHGMVHSGESDDQLLNVEETNAEDLRNVVPASETIPLPLNCSTVTSKKDTTKFSLHEEFTQQNDSTEEIYGFMTKVNGWLSSSSSSNSLPEKKKQAIYSGPITFKRKEGTKPVTHVDKPVETPKYEKLSEYVPSVYASELTEKYTERQKANLARTEDIWGKLERELKERDAAVMAKQNEEPSIDQ